MNEMNLPEQSEQRAKRYSYLLRLWRANRSDGSADWRASLENSLTGERLGFAHLEQLFSFLMTLVEQDNKRNIERSQN